MSDESQIDDTEPRERPASTSRPVPAEQTEEERARGHAGRVRTVPGALFPDDGEEAAEKPAPKKRAAAKK
jgi:hypothetical protein